jgi:hypothetical protein
MDGWTSTTGKGLGFTSRRRPMFGSGDDIAESVFCQKNKSRSLDVNGKVGYKVLTELDLQAVQSGRSPDPKDD